MTKNTLYCMGCGQVTAHAAPGQMLAISCACGATAPILIDDEGRVAPPASIARLLLKQGEPAHLEYYLGYSTHQSEDREKLEGMLRALGCISQGDCEKMECQLAWIMKKP